MSATSPALFRDRRDAGRRLAARLERLRHEAPVVLALTRGGVPVAVEVAGALAAPLDVLVVHEIGAPGAPIGAVAEGGLAVVDHDRADALGAGRLAETREQAGAAADQAARKLRDNRPLRDVVGRTVLLVDDGIDTGDRAIAAARTARRRGAARIVLAVPVAASTTLTRLGEELDEIVCVEVGAGSRWYERAPAVSDAEIVGALKRRTPVLTEGLQLPEAARGVVILAGRSEVVQRTLAAMGFATLELLAGAGADDVQAAIHWLRAAPATERLAIGAFGLGDAAEVVLTAAAGEPVGAVAAAGGRPDRAGAHLAEVTAPVLLVAGGEDRLVLRLARDAGERIAGRHELALVPGATHDFREPGALDQVAHLAGTWFARQL